MAFPHMLAFAPRSSRERGFARISRLLPVIVAIAALAYFGEAYLPVVVGYYRVAREARQVVAAHRHEPSQVALASFVANVHDHAGIALDPGDVRLRRQGDDLAGIQLKLKLPLVFPFGGGGRLVSFDVSAGEGGGE